MGVLKLSWPSMKAGAAGFVFLLALTGGRAEAVLLDLRIDVTMTGFTPLSGGGTPPVDPVEISFSISFDGSADINDTSVGITLLSSNILIDDTFGFSFDESADQLRVGGFGMSNGVSLVRSFENDVFIAISGISTLTPSIAGFLYSQASDAFTFLGSGTNGTLNVSAIPEPGTIGALALGAAGLVAACRKRSGKARRG